MDECTWLDPIDGKRNSGNEKVTLTDISIDDCKKHVDDDKDTMYMSFEYHKTTNKCYLQLVDRHTVRLTVTDANYVYYERDCDGNVQYSCVQRRSLIHILHYNNANIIYTICPCSSICSSFYNIM